MTKLLRGQISMILVCGMLASSCDRTATVSQQNQSPSSEKMTALIDAAKEGDLSAVKRLLAAGADANAADTAGHTALQYAPSSGNVDVVKVLLNAGADVNARSVDGYTALHAAAVERTVQVVETLLAAGADVNARTKNNVTPLMCSIGSPYSDPKISLVLISAGADVNVADSNGETALWVATTASSLEVIEALLKKGANPNVQTNSVGFPGNTPLHMAALNGRVAEAKLLLNYGAKATIRNARGQTPLDVVNKTVPELRQLLEK